MEARGMGLCGTHGSEGIWARGLATKKTEWLARMEAEVETQARGSGLSVRLRLEGLRHVGPLGLGAGARGSLAHAATVSVTFLLHLSL